MRTISILMLAAVSACTAANVQATQPREAAPEVRIWSFEEHAAALRSASCPDQTGFERAQSMEVRVIEAERGSQSARDRQLDGLTLAGAWQLRSDEAGFGGLSGLDVLRSGALLAVTDSGAFVWISVDSETGAPDGLGAIANMRDQDGNFFPNKRDGDSEGLSVRDGLALVSFEQDHRISAFDIEGCGAAARAAPVVALDPVIGEQFLAPNRGPEGFAIEGDTLSIGFEMRRSGGSPIGTVKTDGTLENVTTTQQPLLYLLTGMDADSDLVARIFRAYDPLQGARVILQVDRVGERIAEATFKRPLPVDNFEGVAISQSPSGAPRIWLISDDNFSRNQRTLLLALDLDQ